MQHDKIKGMLDACYLEKRIRELLPELPNLRSRNICYSKPKNVFFDRRNYAAL